MDRAFLKKSSIFFAQEVSGEVSRALVCNSVDSRAKHVDLSGARTARIGQWSLACSLTLPGYPAGTECERCQPDN